MADLAGLMCLCYIKAMPSAAAPAAEGTRSRSAEAYATLKRQIVTCGLAPGSEVSEAELSVRFGLGRTPVREALARLAAERLVRARARRGYVVTPIVLGDVVSCFAVRMLLEPEAAAQAAGRLDARTLGDLEQLDAGHDGGTDPDRVAGFLSANTAFHIAVARASGNARLAGILAGLLEELERLVHAGLRLSDRRRSLVHEHGGLIRALRAGDREAARAEARAQIRAARRLVLEGMISTGALADAAIEVW